MSRSADDSHSQNSESIVKAPDAKTSETTSSESPYVSSEDEYEDNVSYFPEYKIKGVVSTQKPDYIVTKSI